MTNFKIVGKWLYGWQLCENKRNAELGLPSEERDARTRVLISAITGVRESWDEDAEGE